MKRYKVYLFDFDGTLFNTEKSLEFVFKEIFSCAGLPFSNDEIWEIARKPLIDTYKEKNGDPNKYELFCKILWDVNNSKRSAELIFPYDDTLSLLKYLKENKITCGIVTSNSVPHVLDVFECLNIPQDSFHTYIGIKEIKRVKPDPEGILNALKALNYNGPYDEICYVGDGLNDALAAENAGVVPILLDRNNEYNDSKYIVIKSLKELFD